jgi:hypothetical protein
LLLLLDRHLKEHFLLLPLGLELVSQLQLQLSNVVCAIW